LQSGFARQYSLKEAFLVALGGLLVGELKFAVPEARVILADLGPWLRKAGYLRLHTNGGPSPKYPRQAVHDLIFVRPKPGDGGRYQYWRTSLGTPSGGCGLENDLDELGFFSLPGVRVINLGGFSSRFYECVK
jgi:hypothetical protein